MVPESDDHARDGLREWLRAERRAGIQHFEGVPPRQPDARGATLPSARPAPPAPAAPPAATDAPAGRFRADTSAREATRPTAPAPSAPAPSAPRPPVAPALFATSATAPPSTRVVALPQRADLPALNALELDAPTAQSALDELNQRHVRDCRACGLCAERTQTVFGVGSARPTLMFVGEGPGADEDRQGEPFVGKAGQLLTKMIGAMTLTRAQVYIANVVKCRPPENRTPTEEEALACLPYLLRQIAILRPRFIVTLGKPATQTLLQIDKPMGRLRGEWHDFPPPPLAPFGLPTVRVMPTWHPAYLLRTPSAKADTWEDLKQVMTAMGMEIPARG